MLVDQKERLVFPEETAITALRLDMIHLSKSSKNILIAELTAPCEDRLGISYMLKKAKDQSMIGGTLL